jgi:aspartyl-tRNA(Asn)/glutamyl-tRNA(Gln) amidotransferase subunit B
MTWEIVVGIETHAQLQTKSKIFSGAATAFGADPNTQASAVDIALPGALPVLNKAAVELAIRFGLVVGGPDVISRRSVFARKNYFYPDLPKGYQISQYEMPIVTGGSVQIQSASGAKTVRLARAHLEEDAGKSLHEDFHGMSGIDLNRAGTPLLEIVSEPELRGAKEAVSYAKQLHTLLVYYEICDGDMEQGSFRCDANVSVRRKGDTNLGTRCEIKNLNSFLFMEHAIEFEAKRQIEILESGGKIAQETRLYDADRDETRAMRSKEDAQDYRYFPEPDLLPLVISDAEIDRIKAAMPESLEQKRSRFENEYQIPTYNAQLFTTNLLSKGMAFETTATKILTNYSFPKPELVKILTNTANTITSSSSPILDNWKSALVQNPALPHELALIQVRFHNGDISGKQVKEIHDAVLANEGTADEIIRKRGLEQINDSGAIEKLVDEVLAANAKQVADYRAGKEKAFNSLVGQVMKRSQGKANPAQVNAILRRKLAG